MPHFTCKGREIEVDEEGYLVNLDDWNEEAAAFNAKEEDVELTPAHWEIIDLARKYYAEHKTSPNIKRLTLYVAQKLGPEKGNAKHMYGLFPTGPGKLSCKIGGLPKPCCCF